MKKKEKVVPESKFFGLDIKYTALSQPDLISISFCGIGCILIRGFCIDGKTWFMTTGEELRAALTGKKFVNIREGESTRFDDLEPEKQKEVRKFVGADFDTSMIDVYPVTIRADNTKFIVSRIEIPTGAYSGGIVVREE